MFFVALLFVDSSNGCNCDKNDFNWREDSGLLTDKSKLPVIQMRFGDTGVNETGYHTLGKLECFGPPLNNKMLCIVLRI